MGDSLSDVQSWSGTTNLTSPSALMTVKSAATAALINLRGAGGTLDVLGSVAATGLTFGINATTTDSSQYGVLKLSGGNATFNGAITIYGTGSKIIGGAASYGTLTMNHTSNLTLTGNVTLGGAGTNENNFNLVKAGTNTLTLSGANTFNGSTTINAGTLALANQNAIQNSTLVMTGGGNVSFSSAEVANAFTLGGLSGASAGSGYNIALTNNASTAVALSVGNNNASTTYAGVLSGAGSLTKTGSGTLTLSGANTYNGTTTVNAGSLVVNGTLGASSTVTVANGATLGGTGTINGAATVNGNLRPGNSSGVLTFGSNLSLTSTAAITMEINGTTRGTQYDGINVTGPLVYGGSLTFEFGSAFLLGGESFSLFNAGSATAGLTSVTFSGAYGVGAFVNGGSGNWSYNSGGNAWAFSESNGQLAITTAVPEPSTGMLLLASLLAASWVIARRRKIPMA